MQSRAPFLFATLIALTSSAIAKSWMQPGCNNHNYSAQEISQAIQNSSTANQTLKNASCDFGGAGRAESGGNTCLRNSKNFGILQLNEDNLPDGITPDQYLNLPLQQQVDIWASRVGNSNTSGGYAQLSQTRNSGGTIGGAPVSAGMLAACFQFGRAICQNDISYMQSHGGACPSAGNGGININTLPRSQWGRANLDGNNQSICTWGGAIQNKINEAASTCQNNKSGQTDCPTTPGQDTGTPTIASTSNPLPSAATPPSLASSDILVSPTQI